MTESVHNVKASTQYKRAHKADYGHERITILYEDKDIVVIHKPSGMLSVPYPGSKSRTALAVLEEIMRKKGSFSAGHRPFTVHRLDRDTSGVMMFALSEGIQKKVMGSWQRMVTERLYHAVAENPRGAVPALPDSGMIDDPLAQNSRHVGYVPDACTGSRKTVEARTHYKVLVRGETHTLFELSLDTGKKNQIRAHLAAHGYPLAGDENYRARTDPFHRLALHARTLAFMHPTSGEQLRFEVPEPDTWAEYVKAGDKHPEPAIWRQEHGRSQRPDRPPVVQQKRLSRKELSRMDFIAQGKARR